jgi:hypothetical protein
MVEDLRPQMLPNLDERNTYVPSSLTTGESRSLARNSKFRLCLDIGTCTIAAANAARDSRKGDSNVRHNMPWLLAAGVDQSRSHVHIKPPTWHSTNDTSDAIRCPEGWCARGPSRARRVPELVRPPYLASITGARCHRPATWRRPDGTEFRTTLHLLSLVQPGSDAIGGRI